jgi:hypothetical protein
MREKERMERAVLVTEVPPPACRRPPWLLWDVRNGLGAALTAGSPLIPA